MATKSARPEAVASDPVSPEQSTLDAAPRRRRSALDLMELLLWAGGRQLRAGRARGADPLLLREWTATWLALLERYERYCAQPPLLLPSRRRVRPGSQQPALLPALGPEP